jgi:predicted DNA-binding transcriptional regulator YafY
MTRTDRLFALLLRLHSASTLRAADLAAHLEVSERTIYRDMRALTQLGIPIRAEAGHGYSLMDGYRLPPLMLSPDEGLALVMGARLFTHHAEGSLSQAAHTALYKLDMALSPSTRAHAEAILQWVEFAAPVLRLDLDAPTVRHVLAAVAAHRVVRLTYRDRSGYLSVRELEPSGLSYADGAWYVSGFCRLRADTRSFRLSRIETLELLDQPFTPRHIVPSPPTLHTVAIRFVTPTAQRRAHERPHYGYHEERDGLLWYRVNTFDEIIPWVLAFGASAEVVSPPELRAHLRQEAERLAQMLT